MTGPEHYREAERLLDQAGQMMWYESDGELSRVAVFHAAAQVHATLALAAATAEPTARSYTGSDETTIPRAWSGAIS